MNKQEYENKKRKCWEEFWDEISGNIDFAPGVDDRMKEHIYDTFDRAYALGREKETITQEEIEKAAKKYAAEVDKNIRDLYGNIPAAITFGECAAESFREGVKFALGKQEKDAEGEEILTCEKSIAQHMVKSAIRSIQIHDFEGNTIASQNMATFNRGIKFALDQLFGSKCLPDETKDGTMDETKEPKFKVGGIVRFKYCCTPHRIDGFKMLDGVMLYQVGEVWAEESDLAPYTAPEEESRNLSQETANLDKQFDNILKDSFREHNRLKIDI